MIPAALLSALPIKDIATGIINGLQQYFPSEQAKQDAIKNTEAAIHQQLMDRAGVIAEIDKAQIEVNKVDAASENIFKSGWRPAIGWICAIGYGYNFLLRPVLSWLSLNADWLEPPQIDSDSLGILAATMLGNGALRTFEKYKGVHRS